MTEHYKKLIDALIKIADQKLTAEYATVDYFDLCRQTAITSSFETNKKFKKIEETKKLSPIDLFLVNTVELNKLIDANYSPILGNLLLLGYVSAAESYIRTLIRKLINLDSYVATIVAEKTVSFAAAVHHEKELLPEALLEDFSLAGPYNVFETLKEMIGMKGERPSSLVLPSEEFRKVCELRHCCVHRFGKLGSKNAIRLGLLDHIDYLEAPVTLEQADIEEVAFIVENFIRALNNHVFKFILERTAKNKVDEKGATISPYAVNWTWDYFQDKERFSSYYDTFSVTKEPHPSMPPEICYQKFLIEHKPRPQLPERKKRSGTV